MQTTATIAPAYSDNFACEPAEGSERRDALIVGAVLVGISLCAAPFARLKLAPVPTILVIAEAFAIVMLLLTGAICYAQFRVRRFAPIGILACGFSAAGALHIAYTLAFPGVLDVSKMLIGHQTVAWLYVFSRLAPCLGAAAYVAADLTERRGRRIGAADVRLFAIASALYVWAAALVGAFGDRLPTLIEGNGSFSPFFVHLVQPVLLGAPLVAAAFAAVAGVLRVRIGMWLIIMLVATFLEVFDSGTAGSGRFSLGWYCGRFEQMAGCASVVVALHVQLAGILHRAGRASVRSHALFQLSSNPGERSEDVSLALLRIATTELGCEWGFVIRLENSNPVIETSYGAAPDERNPRDRVDNLLLVAATGNGLFSGEDAGLDRRLLGWPTFVSVPLYAGGELYGAIGVASRNPRGRLSEDDRDFVHLIGLYASTAIERDLRGRRLHSLAFSDALTGLANRATIVDRIDDLVVDCARTIESFAVHYLDLDHFKPINDRFGHGIGDEVLREVSRRLRTATRETDCAGRIGGDEFILVQKLAAGESADALSVRLRQMLEGDIDTSAGPVAIGASCGSATFPRDGRDALELLAAADAAQYREKARRRAEKPEPLPSNVTRLARPA